jgi:hypothetical protein
LLWPGCSQRDWEVEEKYEYVSNEDKNCAGKVKDVKDISSPADGTFEKRVQSNIADFDGRAIRAAGLVVNNGTVVANEEDAIEYSDAPSKTGIISGTTFSSPITTFVSDNKPLNRRAVTAVVRNSTTQFMFDAWNEVHSMIFSDQKRADALESIKENNADMTFPVTGSDLGANDSETLYAQMTLCVNLILRSIFTPRIITYEDDKGNQFLSPYEVLKLPQEANGEVRMSDST